MFDLSLWFGLSQAGEGHDKPILLESSLEITTMMAQLSTTVNSFSKCVDLTKSSALKKSDFIYCNSMRELS